ncbi:hypothetical protein GGD65_005293 [Bradyrhizobium sp. CIR18]|nr:hypothetical protein [Bradyrhizobium sp. CIR18]
MSAINGFVRGDAAFLLTDGLSYFEGVPDDVNLNKAHRLCRLNAVVLRLDRRSSANGYGVVSPTNHLIT